MSRNKKILYAQVSGIEAQERVYASFILATAAAATGIEATIYFLTKGVTVVKKGNAEKVKLGDFPPLKEVIDQTVRAGVKLEVCEQSCMLLGLNRADIVGVAEIVGAATLNDRVLEADAVLSL